jgi:hypothetical protein
MNNITSIHIADIYGGHLICSDVIALNKTIIEGIEAKVEKLFGHNRHIYVDLPSTYPEQLLPYMAINWVDGWPEDPDVKTNDESGDEYNGFHLFVVTFVPDISPESIGKIQDVVTKYFDKNAKGWFY